MKDVVDPPACAEGIEVPTEQLIRVEAHARPEPAALPGEGTVAEAYRAYGRMVYNVCLRVTGDYHMAEDAAQATFLIFLRKAETLRAHRDLGGWFYQTAEFVARTTLRGHLRRLRNESSLPPIQRIEYSGENAIQWAEIRPKIDREIARLREIYRAPLIKIYFEGKSQKDTAKALNVPEGTLRRRLFHALQTIRKRLGKEHREISALLLAGLLADHANAVPAPERLYVKIAARSPLPPAAANAVWLATIGAQIKFLLSVAIFIAAVTCIATHSFKSSNAVSSPQTAASQSPRQNKLDRPWIFISELDHGRFERLMDCYVDSAAVDIQSGLFPHVTLHDPVKFYLFNSHDSLNQWGHTNGAAIFGDNFPSLTAQDAFLVHDAPNIEVLNMEAGDSFLLARIVSQLCNADAPFAPRWLKDGIASTYAQSAFSSEAKRFVGCPGRRIDEYVGDMTNGRAVGLAELFAMTEDDYRSSYARFHRVETAAICFVQWMQCTGRFSSLYAEVRAGHSAMQSMGNLDSDFRVWLKDVSTARRFVFEENGKSYVVAFPDDNSDGF
jgi:RNA polymerase sigma factor (sigma-70 family)